MSLGRVLVVGASGGIGRAVVAALLEAGASKVGAHHHRGGARLKGLLAVGRTRVKAFPSDLTRAESAAALIANFARWAGGIDALVVLSGGATPALSAAVTPKQWRADLELNLTTPFFLAREAMKRMRSGGRVVLCSTASAAHGGGPDTLAYGAAKAALECVVKGLARDGAPRGIRVNAVAPGFIKTGFHERLGRSAERVAARAKLVPLGRAGTPEEAAAAVLFLASPSSSYVTGHCLAVSGGDYL